MGAFRAFISVTLSTAAARSRLALPGLALACLLPGSPAVMAETAEAAAEPGYNLRVDAGLGRFDGKYGFDETTTVDVLNLSARWYLPRGELQVSLPYLRLDGPADIRFVSGQPAAGPGGREPSPPAGPPGGPPGQPGSVDEDAEPVIERFEASGLGDIVVQGEYYLMTGTETSPWVIGLVRLKLPTGDDERGLGTGAADFEVGVGLIQRVGGVDLLADAGYTWVGSTSTFDLRDVLRLGVGASRPFGPQERSNAYVYLENRTNTIRGESDRRSLAVGLGTTVGSQLRTHLSASLFVGLSSTAEDVGAYLSAGHRF